MTAPITAPAVAAPPGRRMRKQRTVGSWLFLVAALLTAIAWVFPLWMGLATALKTPAEALATQPWEPPANPTFTNFARFAAESDFATKLWNSVYINIAACAITVTLSLLNAVALNLGRVRRRRGILTVCMIAFAIPQEALVFPTYKAAKMLGLYGETLPLILMLGVMYTALGTFLLGEVMQQFPRALTEAALIDGAGMWRMLRSVVLPVLRPTLVTLAVLVLIWDWNEYMMPLILLPGNDVQTIPIAIASTFGPPGFGSVPDVAWGAAGLVLSSAPTVLVFLVFQRVIARGITVGSD